MTTRATILAKAFGRLGITDYEFAVEPDEWADARTALDGMMAEWEGAGIILGYTPSNDDDNDAVLMTTPAWADQALWNNLALRLAPDFGKTPSPDLKRHAKRGYDLCVAKTIVIPVARRARPAIRGGGDRWRGSYDTITEVLVDDSGEGVLSDG